jgi:hypothetical protein
VISDTRVKDCGDRRWSKRVRARRGSANQSGYEIYIKTVGHRREVWHADESVPIQSGHHA